MENMIQFQSLFTFYGFNLLIIFAFIVLVYNRYQSHELGYVFTYFMFNTIVFFVSLLFSSITLSVGIAFGLFAIFGIMRYRTEPIPIREMTYLFGSITIGLINGISVKNLEFSMAAVPNLAILLLAFILEYFLSRHPVMETRVTYEKIDNIKPENHLRLMEDLRNRTGLDIKKFKITRIDFLRDVARIRVFYIVRNSK